MRYTLTALELITGAALRGGFAPERIERIFHGVPLDFPIVISTRLPLRVDLFGMVGITLFGRVYLLQRTIEYPAIDLIPLVRHEAEHIRQQRHDRLFYLRYVLHWLRNILTPGHSAHGKSLRDRLNAAYRVIPAETEAYTAEFKARKLLAVTD